MNKCQSKHTTFLTLLFSTVNSFMTTLQNKRVPQKHENNDMQAMVKELTILYHKSKLDFPPSPPYLVSVSLIQMQTLSNEKITCYRAQNVFGHAYTCMNSSNLLQHVWSNSPVQCFSKQLVSSSKQQTQNCATDTAICNMMNICNVQLLVSSTSAESEAN